VIATLWAFGPLARDDIAGWPRAEVIISGDGSDHHFRVWVADTPQQRRQGLMGVATMPVDQGMLFIYPGTYHVQMWMKDTPMSLDMLFVQPDGRIAHIVTDTRPGSTQRITSPVPVNAVLEVQAGTTRRLGIQPGDRLELVRSKPAARFNPFGARPPGHAAAAWGGWAR
jgi:uncharacterized membrane protein (UPF0127 family)